MRQNSSTATKSLAGICFNWSTSSYVHLVSAVPWNYQLVPLSASMEAVICEAVTPFADCHRVQPNFGRDLQPMHLGQLNAGSTLFQRPPRLTSCKVVYSHPQGWYGRS